MADMPNAHQVHLIDEARTQLDNFLTWLHANIPPGVERDGAESDLLGMKWSTMDAIMANKGGE
jgi:hypothetical protein